MNEIKYRVRWREAIEEEIYELLYEDEYARKLAEELYPYFTDEGELLLLLDSHRTKYERLTNVLRTYLEDTYEVNTWEMSGFIMYVEDKEAKRNGKNTKYFFID